MDVEQKSVEKEFIHNMVIYKWAQSLYSYCSETYLPFVAPLHIYRSCAHLANLMCYVKYNAGGLMAKYLNNEDAPVPLPRPDDEDTWANVLVPLQIWGKILDIYKLTCDRSISGSLGNSWEEFTTGLAMVDGDNTVIIKRFLGDNNKSLPIKPLPRVKIFFDKSLELVEMLIKETHRYLFELSDKYPTSLLLAEFALRQFKCIFFLNSLAVGPYDPSRDHHLMPWPSQEENRLKKLPLGTLKACIDINDSGYGLLTRCYFVPPNDTLAMWNLEEEERYPISKGSFFCKHGAFSEGLPIVGFVDSYVTETFSVWSYVSGQYLLSDAIRQKAYWFIEGDANAGYIRREANHVITTVEPLLLHNEYKPLADKVIKVVRNNQPEWWPGKVQWSYIKELDKVIREIEYVRRLYELKYKGSFENKASKLPPTPMSLSKIRAEVSYEQLWDKDNPDYIFSSDAIIQLTNNKLPLPTLSKMLTPNNHHRIRYMRCGHRCKVHIVDFYKYAQKRYLSNEVAAEIADAYMADVNAGKAQARKNKKPR